MALDRVVQPVGGQAGAGRHPGRRLAGLPGRAEEAIHVPRGGTRVIGEAHDRATHHEKFAFDAGPG
jgi:hypothetical protein